MGVTSGRSAPQVAAVLSGAGVCKGPLESDGAGVLTPLGVALGVGDPTGQAKAAPTSAPTSTKA